MLRKLSLAALLIVLPLSQALAETVTITKSDLQAKVSAAMPIKYSNFYVSITIRNPVVVLEEKNNRMVVNFTVDALNPLAVKAAATGQIDSMLLYDARKGAIHLHGPTVYNLEHGKIEGDYAQSVDDATKEAILKHLSGLALHTLSEKESLKKLSRSEVLSTAIKGDTLTVTLGEKK